MAKATYGIDAPGVVRNLLVFGAAGIAVPLVIAAVTGSPALARSMRSIAATGPGPFLALAGLLMLAYSLVGKFRHRDRMLAQIDWNGDERVLDVGTGRGLLAIGAARKLSTGRATGIDVWSGRDLSQNTARNAVENARREGVADRVDFLSQDARRLDFSDESFDVVLSNLCLHNIASAEDRARACSEIARVARRGGTVVLSDFQKTAEYARALSEAGLQVARSGPFLFDTFPPLRIITARKP